VRTKTIACLLAVLCPSATGPRQVYGDEAASSERIVFAPHEDLIVDKRFERTHRKTVESVTARSGDDERVETPGQSYEGSRTIALRDTYRSKFGPVFVVERSFEELTDHTAAVGAELRVESTSPLEGRTVLVTWDWEENDVTAAFVGEDEPDDAEATLLRGLTAVVDLTSFLPRSAVAVGDTWDVPFERFKWDVLKPFGYLGWESDPPNPAADWLRQQVWKAYNGDIEATYARRLDTDDGPIAVIEFRGTIESEVDLDVPDDGRLPRSVDIDYEAEGEVHWDLARNLPRNLTMSTRGTTTETYEAVREAPEETVTVEIRYGDTSEQTFTFE
jgi:hypothetical protein